MKNLASFWRLPIAITMLLVSGYGQNVIHSGEAIFVIAVSGGRGVAFSGSYLVTAATGEAKTNRIEGNVPAEFRVVGTTVHLDVQNQSPGGEVEIRLDADGKRTLDRESPSKNGDHFLEVELSKNGTTLKRQRTDAPYGVITLASTMPLGGVPQLTEFQVEGSVKYAFLTLTSETGDVEQELVPVPFSQVFYPKEGWIVGLMAQKTRVTRPEPMTHDGRIQVLADGKSGSVHVAIRVNGTVLNEAETSQPYGVANATVRIP